jgi:hypothetical protein
MTTPEARARQNIDSQLTACGWVVQDRAVMNLYTGIVEELGEEES